MCFGIEMDGQNLSQCFETAILNTSTEPLSFGAQSSSRKCLKRMESVLMLEKVCTAGGIGCGLQRHLKEGNRP